MRRVLPGAILFIILLFIISVTVSAIQVSPLVLNFDLNPGDIEEFELILTGGIARETIELNIMHPVQGINGRISYKEIDESHNNPAVDWIELETSEVTVPADEEIVVRGNINIPFGASGSHTATIMVDQSEPMQRPGAMVGFRIRYAVRININVDSPGHRASVEIIDFSLEADDQGHPIITSHFKNTSPLRFPVEADVTIRSEDRRLLERVPIYSPATSLSRRGNFQVYPHNELIFNGEVTQPLFPGQYELQLFMRYADGRQIIQRQTVELEEEFLREEAARFLSADPEEIVVSTLPGASSTQMLKLTNHFNEPLLIKTYQSDIRTEYEHSLYDSQGVELRGDNQFVIRPGGFHHQLLIFRPGREQKPGGYYGYHDIEVYTLNQEKLEEHKIKLTSVVEGEIDYRAEIMDLSHHRGDELDTFSVTFENTGEIDIIPRVRVQLIDANEEIYANINMNQQEEERILPGFNSYLTAERRLVTEGEYKAIVTLEADNKELDKKEFSLTIGDSE